MKKVLALVLAVMMVSTVGFAVKTSDSPFNDPDLKYYSSVTPSGSIDVSREDGIGAGAESVVASGTSPAAFGDAALEMGYIFDYNKLDEDGKQDQDSGKPHVNIAGIFADADVNSDATDPGAPSSIGTDDAGLGLPGLTTRSGDTVYPDTPINGVEDFIFRSINNENYSVSSVRVVTGKSLVKGVSISDKDQKVAVEFVDDLNNTTARTFDLNYTLRGKGKMIINNDDELYRYILLTNIAKNVKDRVTIPSLKFSMSGTVGYGKVEVNLGNSADQDLDGLLNLGIQKSKDVVKFTYGGTIGDTKRIARAGSYTADAILTEDYDEAMTLEARVYSGDTLYFDVDNDPDREVIGTLADVSADMDFYSFTSQKDFITFNSTARLIFNDADEDCFVYKIVDKKLSPIGSYDEDEGCWVVKERILGTYVVSDTALDQYMDLVGSDDIANPDTGANDVVGIATALAAVALVSAAAISLKK